MFYPSKICKQFATYMLTFLLAFMMNVHLSHADALPITVVGSAPAAIAVGEQLNISLSTVIDNPPKSTQECTIDKPVWKWTPIGDGVTADPDNAESTVLSVTFNHKGTYTIGADVTAKYSSSCSTSTIDAEGSKSFTIQVVDVSIAVRPKKANGSGDYSAAASICAGGVGSNAHMADVLITTDPLVSDCQVKTVLSGGEGVSQKAILDLGQRTGADGTITGTLTSSDKIESATLSTSHSTATVNFDWNLDWTNASWVSDPENIAPTSHETVHLFHHGEPVNGHQLHFVVEKIIYSDDNGQDVTVQNPTAIATYASFGSDPVSDTGGSATATLTTSSSSVKEEDLTFYDMRVVESQSTDVDGLPLLSHPAKMMAEQIKAYFRSKGDIKMLTQTATKDQPGAGSGMQTGTKVSPGQSTLLQLQFQDSDEVSFDNQNWQTFLPIVPMMSYKVTFNLTHATFTDTGFTYRSVTPQYTNGCIFNISSLPITIDTNWTGIDPVTGQADPVKVEIQVEDDTLVPQENLAGGQTTDLQDPQAQSHFTLEWDRATVYPTEVSSDKQVKIEVNQAFTPSTVGAAETITTDDDGLMMWFLYGKDLNGPANDAPNYENDSVNEIFGDRTSNIKRIWLQPGLIAAFEADPLNNPWTDKMWSDKIFPSGGSHSTFTIGPDDHTSDSHKGRTFEHVVQGEDVILNSDGKKTTIWVDLPQYYQAQPGVTLKGGSFNIRRSREGKPDETATYKIQVQQLPDPQ